MSITDNPETTTESKRRSIVKTFSPRAAVGMIHTLARATSVGLFAAGVILGATGVASADPLVDGGDGGFGSNDETVSMDPAPTRIVSPEPGGGDGVGYTPWQIFCLKNFPLEGGEQYRCLLGLP
jgi:hypothetical protein